MNPVEMNWLQLINTGGVIAILVIAVVGFMKGNIWPRSTVEKCIAQQKETSEKSAEIIGTKLADAMTDGVKGAVQEGISLGLAEGYIKIVEIQKNNGPKGQRG